MKRNKVLLLGLSLSLLVPAFLISSSKEVSDVNGETTIVHIGDKVEVNKHTFTYGLETKEVEGTIIYPDGSSYVGNYFNTTMCGVYKVVYKAYFNKFIEKTFVEEYVCERRAIDTFDINNNTTISHGDYRYNTAATIHKGVILDMKSGATPTFNLPISLSKLTKETPLIDLIIDPSIQNEADFSKLTIRISDIKNETNFVDVVLDDGGLNYVFGLGLNAKAGANGQLIAGYHKYYDAESKNYHTSTFDGAAMFSSFRARPANNPTRDFKLYFDYEDKSLYGTPSAIGSIASLNYINKLDNEAFYQANPWKGFDSNAVKVSLIPANLENQTCRVLVKSVGGYDLTNYVLEDSDAPVIHVDFKNQNINKLPNAKVGEYFNIFDATVIDNFDYELKPSISVKHVDSVNQKQTDVTLENNKFKVTKEGTYYIYYNAVDSFGNKANEVKIRIKTRDSIDDVDVSLPTSSSSYSLFDEATIPSFDELIYSGGSGNLTFSKEIKDPKGNKVNVTGNKLTLSLIGDYVVTYKATDYLGHYATFDYVIKSQSPNKPIFLGEPSLPFVLVKGFTYEIPKIGAIEGKNGEIVDCSIMTKINNSIKEGTFEATGESVNVKYIASGTSGESIIEKDIPVIDGDDTINRPNYFYGDMSVTENESEIRLTASSDSDSVTFANKLNGFDFRLEFAQVAGRSNYTRFVIKLFDALDTKVSLTFKVDFATKKMIMPYSGVGDFTSSPSGDFVFNYTNINKQVYGANSSKVGMVLYDDLGNEFKGFSDGVYMSLSFEGISEESQINLTKLNNHVLGYWAFEDEASWMEPEIFSADPLLNRQMMGEDFVYPRMKAYSVFGEVDYTQIRVRDPNNKTKVNTSGDEKETFKIDTYGTYRIEYTAIDALGHEAVSTLTVFVFDDIAPTLQVSDMKSSYGVNETITLPTYNASDNSGKVTVDMYLISPLGEILPLIHDENASDNVEAISFITDENLYTSSFRVSKNQFKLSTRGTYTIRCIATDAQFNKTSVNKVFNVK